jgi:hypothetical protein
MEKTDKEFLAHLRCAETWLAFRIRELAYITVNSKYDMLLKFKDGRKLYADEVKPVEGIEGKDYEKDGKK